jgi:hypothetical protein
MQLFYRLLPIILFSIQALEAMAYALFIQLMMLLG